MNVLAIPLTGAAKYAVAYKAIGFGYMALGGPVLVVAGIGIGVVATALIIKNKNKQKERRNEAN